MIRAADDFKAIKERMQVIRNEIEMARAAENPPQPVDPHTGIDAEHRGRRHQHYSGLIYTGSGRNIHAESRPSQVRFALPDLRTTSSLELPGRCRAGRLYIRKLADDQHPTAGRAATHRPPDRRCPSRCASASGRVITKLAIEVERNIKLKLSASVLNVRTGVLRASIHHQVLMSATSVTATIGTGVNYARIHEFGVPHSWEIPKLKSARVLAFEVGGESVFTRRVTHPALPERLVQNAAHSRKWPLHTCRDRRRR